MGHGVQCSQQAHLPQCGQVLSPWIWWEIVMLLGEPQSWGLEAPRPGTSEISGRSKFLMETLEKDALVHFVHVRALSRGIPISHESLFTGIRMNIEDFVGVLTLCFRPQMGTADLKKLELFSWIQRTLKATKSGPNSHCPVDVFLFKQEKSQAQVVRMANRTGSTYLKCKQGRLLVTTPRPNPPAYETRWLW